MANTKRLTDSTSNFRDVLHQDEGQNICIGLRTPDEVISRYDSCINKANKIITEINQEYDFRQD
jgi:hypothetical protein